MFYKDFLDITWMAWVTKSINDKLDISNSKMFCFSKDSV